LNRWAPDSGLQREIPLALKSRARPDDYGSMAFDLDSALTDTIRVGASDLHLKVPSVPRIRVAGRLMDLPSHDPLRPEDTLAVKDRVLTNELKRADYDGNGSADLSYFTPHGRFRVSAFSQRGSASFVFRVVPDAPQTAQLGLPETVSSWADARRGLVVVTGPTGAGKSTTCAALLDRINRRRACHILTIEDPIEFLHADRKAIVCQREIGLDAPSHQVALRAALRQDPDVIMIGEVRDEDTAMTALRAAETGHLVICTLHTIDAAETVQRFIDLFGENHASLARQMFASTLVGVCSQRLVPSVGGGVALNAEVLVNSSRMRDMIVEEEPQATLRKAIAEGGFYGMRTFDQCLLGLVTSGIVKETDAVDFASNGHDFKLMLKQSGYDPASSAPADAPAVNGASGA
jgi:twitching motility protein PilT